MSNARLLSRIPGLIEGLKTATDIEETHIPSQVESLRVAGRDSPGDGPILNLVRGNNVPGAVQSADGQWWEDLGYNTITVRIPSNFPTLQSAIDHYSRLPLRQGALIILLIESGHSPSSGISVTNGDYSHFYIRSEDAVVTLDSGYGRAGMAFIEGDNVQMPVLDCLVDANSQLNNGYLARNGSRGFITPESGITHVWGTGLNVNSGSNVSAADTVWTHCALNGNTGSGAVVTGGHLYAPGIDVSHSGYYGGQSAYGAVADFSGGKANNCARYGWRCRNASSMDVESAEANDCGVNAIRAFHNGQIAARYFVGKNAGEDGIFASDASTVVARDADFTGATRYGIVSTGGATVDARGTNARRGASNSPQDFRVETGGSIVLHSTTSVGGISQTVNIPTSDGIISQRSNPNLTESGTWTPGYSCSDPGDLSVDYNDQVGRYIRVGDMVTVTFTLTTNSFTHSTASGSLRITGLPFPSVDLFRSNWQGSLVFSNIDKPGFTNFVLELNEGDDYLSIRASGNGQARDFVDISDVTTTNNLRVEGTLTYWKA